MQEYKAYFDGGKRECVLSLILGTVDHVREHRRGELMAYVTTPEGEKFHFRVSKSSQPFGARCQVYSRDGSRYPCVSHRKAKFVITENTVVLFPRPLQTGASVYPVISWNEYQEALKKIRTPVEPILRSKDHRWVDDPPLRTHHKHAAS